MGIFSRKSVSRTQQSLKTNKKESVGALETKLQLVTGKGGVGRTTIALALAHAFAQRGEEVLLVEARDAESELQNDHGLTRSDSMLGRTIAQTVKKEPMPIELGAEPIEVVQGLWCAQLIAPVGHAAFLRSMIPSDRLVKAALESKPLSKFLRSAPSMHELGLFYHLKKFDEDTRFQRIVIDLPATGHTLALSQLPDKISKIIKKGQIVEALRAGMATIADATYASMWVVTLPELLPLTEADEVAQALERDGIKPAGIICNRGLSRMLTPTEENTLNEILKDLSERPDLDSKESILKTTLKRQLINETERELLQKFQDLYQLPELSSHEQRVEFIITHWLKD